MSARSHANKQNTVYVLGALGARRAREPTRFWENVPNSKPEQLPLPFYGKTIDVDNLQDRACPGITYWGKATCVFDNIYRCLANVRGVLCVVEISVFTSKP